MRIPGFTPMNMHMRPGVSASTRLLQIAAYLDGGA